jgi:hypothetical protein
MFPSRRRALPDDTVAIKRANEVSVATGIPVFFPAGNYRYKPSIPLNPPPSPPNPLPGIEVLRISHVWQGEGPTATCIYCDGNLAFGLYEGQYFRMISSGEIRDMAFRAIVCAGSRAGVRFRTVRSSSHALALDRIPPPDPDRFTAL